MLGRAGDMVDMGRVENKYDQSTLYDILKAVINLLLKI